MKIFGHSNSRTVNTTYLWAGLIMLQAVLLPAFDCRSAAAEEWQAVRVMTQNMFSGTNLGEVSAATNVEEFLAAVTTTYQHVEASRPAERAAVIAREIAREQPELVGLQEVAILRTGAMPPATTVASDSLQPLLEALARLNTPYEIVAVIDGLDAEAPSTLGFDVRLTLRDVIIARTNRALRHLSLSNPLTHLYAASRSFVTPAGPITYPSSWVSVDVDLDGRKFRFVTTHLDVVPAVALLQAQELTKTALDTDMPTILVCDCNSTPDISSDPSFPTYQTVQNAGFTDAFRTAHPQRVGFTCCQDEDLLNDVSVLNVRVDLIQFRGDFMISDIRLIGNTVASRARLGLWPSDHAGVVGTLEFSRNE